MNKLTAIAMSLVLAVICTPAVATTYSSVFSGPLGSVPVDASATLNAGVWTYQYTVDISGLNRNATGLSIGNPYGGVFENAANDRGLTNPVFLNTDSIMWTAGSVSPALGTIAFSFTSTMSPGLVDATVWGGAFPSTGRTLGLVPEAPSLVSLGSLSLGAFGYLIRRRTRQ